MCIYIYIYPRGVKVRVLATRAGEARGAAGESGHRRGAGREPPSGHSATIGRHSLSNAPCLIRPLLFYALFIASMIIMICCIIRHF